MQHINPDICEIRILDSGAWLFICSGRSWCKFCLKSRNFSRLVGWDRAAWLLMAFYCPCVTLTDIITILFTKQFNQVTFKWETYSICLHSSRTYVKTHCVFSSAFLGLAYLNFLCCRTHALSGLLLLYIMKQISRTEVIKYEVL